MNDAVLLIVLGLFMGLGLLVAWVLWSIKPQEPAQDQGRRKEVI